MDQARVEIRDAELSDLAAIAALQARCSAAAQWAVTAERCLVAAFESSITGFLLWHSLGAGESEILNLAVAPEVRRRGIARALVEALKARCDGAIFLEVRESNRAARELYRMAHFQEVGRRQGYYPDPPESAIVMKFHSC